MNAYLVDDEPLAIERLERLLRKTGRVEVLGSHSNPFSALDELRQRPPDLLLLDIEMPGLSGFELLERLGDPQPLVVFTTAYDQYALDAFRVCSIDYLLKPVETEQLLRTLNKLDRMLATEARNASRTVLAELREMFPAQALGYITRVTSRVGARVTFIDVNEVSYFYAKNKLTFAALGGKHVAVDSTIADLERRLDSRQWIRIRRSTVVRIDAVRELQTWFGGKLIVRLMDGKTELVVAGDRVGSVKAKLGL